MDASRPNTSLQVTCICRGLSIQCGPSGHRAVVCDSSALIRGEWKGQRYMDAIERMKGDWADTCGSEVYKGSGMNGGLSSVMICARCALRVAAASLATERMILRSRQPFRSPLIPFPLSKKLSPQQPSPHTPQRRI